MQYRVDKKLWSQFKCTDYKKTELYAAYARSNKVKFWVCFSLFLLGCVAGWIAEHSISLGLLLGSGIVLLPASVCYATALVNRNSIFGGLRRAMHLQLQLGDKYGVLSWRMATHYGLTDYVDQFNYDLVRAIIVFPKRTSVMIYAGGYYCETNTCEPPKTYEYYPTERYPNNGRWIQIPLVFEDNDAVMNTLAQKCSVQITVSESSEVDEVPEI